MKHRLRPFASAAVDDSSQRFHRTLMAIAEVRTHLSRRLRRWTATVRGAGALLPLLQSPAPTPGAGLQNARGSVPPRVNKETPVIEMGALPPNPRDLAQFFARMDDFAFVLTAVRRTMETLDRRVGQRRDATRAPIQVRNGWRSHDRLLLTPPPRHLRTVVFLSNRWGPLHSRSFRRSRKTSSPGCSRFHRCPRQTL